MSFRTKLDFSDNRQVKQRIETIQNLSGATTFGVTFSVLPTGPDLTTSAITLTTLGVASTFSGNPTTTIFTWYDSNMGLADSVLSAITPSNSATTKNTGAIFTADTTTTIDGNTVILTYTGVSFDISVTAMVDLGGGTYSGTVNTNSLNYLSAGTLDFTGRTIWSDTSGITRTERLIVTKTPQVGYVLTCIDSEGMVDWQPSSGYSGTTISVWTAGTGSNSAVLSGSGSIASGSNSVAAGNGNTVTGNRSVVLGGSNIIGSADDTVYTPKVVSLFGISAGTFNIPTLRSTNYTEFASNATSNNVAANINIVRPYGLTADTSASFVGANNIAYWNRDTPYTLNLSTTTAALVGSNNAAYISASGGSIGRVIGVRSSIISTKSGVTINNAQNFRANAPDGIQGMYGIQELTGFHMETFNTSPGYSAGTTVLWGVYIEEGKAANYFADNVWVGTTSGSESLDINGNGRFRIIGSTASAGALHYTADGTLTTNTSDVRLKTNIKTLTGALDKVKSLRGVTYNWNENPSGDTRIGFIAQEVNSVVPELSFVNPNSSELYMGVHYDNVTALLVEAVKELSSGTTNNTHLETQTILAEDNNIELNYGGNQTTALGGGITVLHANGEGVNAELITDENGDWKTNNDFIPNSLTIPYYTPSSSSDTIGKRGNITRDDDYLYIKTKTGWKRSNLENF